MKPTYTPLSRSAVVAMIVLLAIMISTVTAQIHYTQPPPGSIYREYARVMNPTAGNDWRVTDPNFDCTPYGQSICDLHLNQNPQVGLTIDDLQGAVRAEMVITLWNGHVGTWHKQVRFNGNNWINIPELGDVNGVVQGRGQCYMGQEMVTIDVPLGDLVQGFNYFEGTNGGQDCYNFAWGQFGWYGVIVRVYYGSSKAHPTGSITSPGNGAFLSSNQQVTATASSSAGIAQVDFLAYYDGFDTDGDGVYLDYHNDYHIGNSESGMNIRNHVGTSTSSPFQVNWDNTWVPDQTGIKMLARIKDNNGVWFVTDEVTGLSFLRPSSSLKLYKPYNTTEHMWSQDGNTSNPTCNVDIPGGDDLGHATEAAVFVRTWNGIDGDAPPGHFTRLNTWYAPNYGQDHYFSNDLLTGVDIGALNSGTNTYEFYSAAVTVHGIEVLWPGPALMVRYNVPLPIQLGTFAAALTLENAVSLTWSTVSETNNYGFEVQKSVDGPNNFSTIPNSFVAGHGTTLAPQHYSFVDKSGVVSGAYYRLKQTDLDGSVHYTESVRVDAAGEKVPQNYLLEQNSPNPFNPTTTIRFGLPKDGFVSLKLYNVLGQVVRTLVEEQRVAGYYEVRLDASNLSSGTYIYRLESGKFVSTKKLLLVR